MPDNFTTTGRDLVGRIIDGTWELVSILGVGAYGVVYLGVNIVERAENPRKPLKYAAVKCLARAGLDKRQSQFQRREIVLHQLASSHPNIASVQQVIEDDKYIFVVMDYCAGGDLFAMITERQRYVNNDEIVRSVFLQIIDAVGYCHSMGIFHRDLKPENILCSADGTRVYVADFGLATTERRSTAFGW
jgi:serine/threonine protein kinase